MSGHPALPSARSLFSEFTDESLLTWLFPFRSFPSTDPTLFFGYKFPLFLAVFEVKANLSLLLQNPIAVAPNLTCLRSTPA